MVSSYKIDEFLSFLENIDLLIVEGWSILMKQPCVVDYSSMPYQDIIHATMELRSDRTYHMDVLMPFSLASKLAIEFYGDDFEADDEMVVETVGEFLNIIAGNVQGIVSQNALLGSPKVERLDSFRKNISGMVRTYTTKDGSFVFSIHQ